MSFGTSLEVSVCMKNKKLQTNFAQELDEIFSDLQEDISQAVDQYKIEMLGTVQDLKDSVSGTTYH